MMVRERRNWTAEEDALLKNAVELASSADFQSLPWNEIALSVPGRTNKDCRKRFHYKVSSNLNRGAWTKTEDQKLRAAVQKYGSKWSQVANDVETRNGEQCSKRWTNTIDPRIDRSAWSSQDEQILSQSVEKMGHNWKAIVTAHFPGRTALQARNQYKQLCRRTGSDTQPSTPGSLHSPPTPSSTQVSLSNVPSAGVKSRRPSLRDLPADADMEEEESDDNLSGEDENDEHDDDADWAQSDKYLQWKPTNEASHMAAHRSPLHRSDLSPVEFEPLIPPSPSDEMQPFVSLDQYFPDQSNLRVGGGQTLGQASNPPQGDDQVTGHSLTAALPHSSWTGFPNSAPVASESCANQELRKQVEISATCSHTELGNLIQTTAEALESVSFAITSQDSTSTARSSKPLEGGSRHVVVTATCLPDELGKLIEVVTDNVGCVSFTVSSKVS